MPKKIAQAPIEQVVVKQSQKTRVGVVDKISGINTVRVVSYESIIHPIYKKRFTRTHHILADTHAHEVVLGDTVVLHETRLISKRKAWVVMNVQKNDKKTGMGQE